MFAVQNEPTWCITTAGYNARGWCWRFPNTLCRLQTPLVTALLRPNSHFLSLSRRNIRCSKAADTNCNTHAIHNVYHHISTRLTKIFSFVHLFSAFLLCMLALIYKWSADGSLLTLLYAEDETVTHRTPLPVFQMNRSIPTPIAKLHHVKIGNGPRSLGYKILSAQQVTGFLEHSQPS